jgi:uncharacterized repeat protein (TIGR03803 family)
MRAKALISLSQLVAMLILSAAAAFAGPGENTLYTFSGGADGAWPKAGVIVGPDGALYGVTQYGGANTFGTVYRVAQNSNGTWTETVIYNFTDTNDGAGPIGQIAFDAAGNIYGTTAFGKPYEQGTVYKLTPGADGTYSATLLYAFTGGADGQQPVSGVVLDKAGNIYGTTPTGGSMGDGVVFEVSPNSDGTWSENVIHNFGETSSDAVEPLSNLLMDAAGNLYGAAGEGGSGTYRGGAVFELSPNGTSTWTENILYSFNGNADGAVPDVIAFDKSGNIYGTAGGGGIVNSTNCPHGCGTIFRLAKSTGGNWPYTRAYAFNGTSGYDPNGITFDSEGNIYGTTLESYPDLGTVFELKRGGAGQRWTYSLLYDFGATAGGIEPTGLIIHQGSLYGSTLSTTTCYLCGTVWEVTP